MLTDDKPVVIVGFPILSKLVRGLSVELPNVCLIPDDQLHNESVNTDCTVTFEEPQNKDNSEAVERAANTGSNQLAIVTKDLVDWLRSTGRTNKSRASRVPQKMLEAVELELANCSRA